MPIGAADPDRMTPEQRAVHDRIAAGPRGGVPRPFLAMLDSPGLAHAIQGIGAALRFSGALADDLREIAILAAAGAFGSGYEWGYHEPIARRAGVSEAAIAAARAGDVSSLGGGDIAAAIITVCHRAVRNRRVPREALALISTRLGRAAATEVVAIAGYYPMLALFLDAANLDHPIPAAGDGRGASPVQDD
ncbi:MAG: carboxymuconolactone decarboxylase family protein [Bauldia sp.]|nr:carboxymuconolactone decarboxylase family protein [Bauldia sp.]